MKAVIMSGGRGTRFWPASRSRKPKQFLKITGRRTLVQQTFERLQPLLSPHEIFFVCSSQYAGLLQQQIPGLEEEQIILEPAGRNTAPCIGLAAHYLERRFGDEVMAVLPADHTIGDTEAFQKALGAAQAAAGEKRLVTFGIEPTRPATGYGYIERGKSLGLFSGLEAFRVRNFREKPDLETARSYVQGRDHYWNSGMFVWRTSAILEEINSAQPELGSVLRQIAGNQDRQRVKELFEGLESLSIDYAVMEKSKRVTVIPVRFDWDDVGDWRALFDHLPSDREGNHSNTTLVPLDAQNCLGYSTGGRLIALVGVQDLVVVDADGVLLVCHRERTQDIKKILENIESKLL